MSNNTKGLNSLPTSMKLSNNGTFLPGNPTSSMFNAVPTLTPSKSGQTSTVFVMSTTKTNFLGNPSMSHATTASSKVQPSSSGSPSIILHNVTPMSSFSLKINSRADDFSRTTRYSFFSTNNLEIALPSTITSSSYATSSDLRMQASTSRLSYSMYQKLNSFSSSISLSKSNNSASLSFLSVMSNNLSSTLTTNTAFSSPTPGKSFSRDNITSSNRNFITSKSNNYIQNASTSITLVTYTTSIASSVSEKVTISKKDISSPTNITISSKSNDHVQNSSKTQSFMSSINNQSTLNVEPSFSSQSFDSGNVVTPSYTSFISPSFVPTPKLSTTPFFSSSLMASTRSDQNQISKQMSSPFSQAQSQASLHNSILLTKTIPPNLSLTKISSSLNGTIEVPNLSSNGPTATYNASFKNETSKSSITLSQDRLLKSSKTIIQRVTSSSSSVAQNNIGYFWEVDGILFLSPKKSSSKEYNDLRKKNNYKKLGDAIEKILDAALTSVSDYIYSKVLVITSKDNSYRIQYECMFKLVLKKSSSETASTLKEKIKNYNDTYGFGEFVLHSVQTSVDSPETSPESTLSLWAIIVIAVLGSVCLLLLIAFIYTRRKLNKSEYERNRFSPVHDNNSNSRFKGFFPTDYDGYDASSNIPLKLTSLSSNESKKSPKRSDTAEKYYSGGDEDSDDEKKSYQGSLDEEKDDGINIGDETSLGNGTGALQIQESGDESVEDEAKFSTFSRKH
ncbi:uncharacterized protein LOC114537547 isoform X2 [Dendronephthya gigantea]|nr:uncharacterized protein LOC114537547 isoform X2 [Dendronephthya gigantea]